MAGLLDTVLDMSLAARMARAREMGFNVDTPLYHGTTRDFRQFDVSAPKTTLGGLRNYGVAVSPDPRVSSRYATDFGTNGSNVMPLYSRANNPLKLSAGKFEKLQHLISKIDEGKVLTEAEAIDLEMIVGTADKHPIQAIKDAGFDAIEKDAGRYGAAEPEVLVFEPEKLRSIHAAFDPARSSSSDLLAGVAPWAVAGGLGLLAGAMPGESRADKLSREMTHREPSRYVSGLERLQAGLQAGGATPVPVASDVMGLLGDALMYYNDPSSRTWGNAAMTGLGLLPFVP